MNKIFQDAKDKNVKSFVVFGKAADHKLYTDSTYTAANKATQAEVEDAFWKGMLLIKIGDIYCKPVALDGNKVYTATLEGSPAAATVTEWTAVATA